jgi:penicillin-binding protein 1A
VQSGTGTKANIGCPAAGKTGTTDNFNDAWFVGYTPKLATATWMGYPNALTPMPGVAGGTYPASIWHDYMNVAHGSDCSDFPQPKQAADFSSGFYGHYSSTGSSSSRGSYSNSSPYSGGGTGTQQGGGSGGNNSGGGYRGYDPRLYEAPPQQAPKAAPPAKPSPSPQGNGNGK